MLHSLLARRLPRAIVGRVARLVRRGPGVSVVVVVTDDNVFFLDECIDALGRQTRRADEVLLAVVGVSPLTESLVARQQAASHRVRRLAVPGATTAAARDRAVADAHGELLLVLDCGHRPDPGLLAAMADSLATSGSDVVVAGQPRDLAGVGVREAPGVIAAPATSTRMFRRALWQADEVVPALDAWLPGARMLLRAGSLDTVTTPVGWLPERGTGLAFGAMPVLAPAAEPFAAAVREVLAALRERAGEDAAAVFLAWVLDRELPRHLDDVERCTDAQWAALSGLCAELEGPVRAAGVEARVRTWLAARQRRAELEELSVDRWLDGGQFPTEVSEGRVLAVLGVDVPDEVRALTEVESPLEIAVRRVRSGPSGVLDLELFAWIRGLGSEAGPRRCTAVLVTDGGERVDLATTPGHDPEVDIVAGERFHDHAGDVLHVLVDPPPAGAAEVEVRAEVSGVVRRARVPCRRPPSRVEARGTRLTAIAVEGPDLVVHGLGNPPAGLLLAGEAASVAPRLSDRPDGFEARFELEHDPFSLGRRPLPVGVYQLRVALDPGLARSVPRAEAGAHHRVRLRASPERTLVVDLAPLLRAEEIGPAAQQRLVRAYATVEPRLDPTLVYFQSYVGEWPTDSPLAIHHALRRRRPDLRPVWLTRDGSAPVPEGAGSVLLRSREWYDVLARAGSLVTNVDLDDWFVRRPGQRVLQTYHGYPSKAMGRMAWAAKGFGPRRVERMLRRTSGTWDLLVCPSPSMEHHFRQQFDYDGPIVSEGYPRDDALVGPDAATVRARAREQLGIRPDQRAVLYAPTWRDDLATNFRVAPMAALLDLAELTSALGEDHVVLLRGHRFHRGRPTGARVLDVTSHPEVNDLVLAADAAVLDYSSLRFEAALAGVPTVFLVPDLDRYTGGVRGFLHDFAQTAPGPMVSTTAEVVGHLRDVDRLAAETREERERFVARYLAQEDGHASDRVVEAFFEAAEDP